ncbi:HTH-type transcriptional repressor of iron proteins A [Azoarcus sp. Aa7]|nr:HTH-type transcriptional repressor of iron proteins A [Azoarcus sp. Aa7]
MDRLSPLLNRFALTARVFYSGTLCGITTFEASDEAGHLHVVRRGPLQVQGADRSLIDIDEPSLLFYPRPASHRLRADRQTGADVVCASVEFGGGLGNPLARALPPVLLVRLAELPALASTLALLLDEAFEQRSGRQAIVDRLCEVVLVHLLRHTIEHRLMPTGLFAGLADPRLAKAIQAMHDEPARKWLLEELAERAGMSRARFAVNFRETVGQTPLDYLTDWRIGLAQTLLRKGRPVKIVADEVGYGSAAALARAFTARLGVPPIAWTRGEPRRAAPHPHQRPR